MPRRRRADDEAWRADEKRLRLNSSMGGSSYEKITIFATKRGKGEAILRPENAGIDTVPGRIQSRARSHC